MPQDFIEPSIENSNETQIWLPGVYTYHRKKVKQVLILEYGAFAKDENDVGKIDSLKLKLHLSDNKEVQKPYHSIQNICIQK